MADLMESVSSYSSMREQEPSTSSFNPVPNSLIETPTNPIIVENQLKSTILLANESLLEGQTAEQQEIQEIIICKDEPDEPDLKRKKVQQPSYDNIPENLESRLSEILCCTICNDLPKRMYQCELGHLLCDSCYFDFIADGLLNHQLVKCPNCNIEISRKSPIRNFAVEKAILELSEECEFCFKDVPRKTISFHKTSICNERPINCKYIRIGCQWKGPDHNVSEHEKNCLHQVKTAFQIISTLELADRKYENENKKFSNLINLLSFEKISINDLHIKSYYDGSEKFFKGGQFMAFEYEWLLKAKISETIAKQIDYKLILKSKTNIELSINFLVLKDEISNMKINPKIYNHIFTNEKNESEYNVLPFVDDFQYYGFLAAKVFNFRLLMFLSAK